MALYQYYEQWLQHDGKVIRVDGKRQKLRVRVSQRTYPYAHTAIDISASWTNKKDPEYLDIKRTLGDDWVTDVLSCPETATKYWEAATKA